MSLLRGALNVTFETKESNDEWKSDVDGGKRGD